jgi:4,5-DOPA dioxygenase extradiol
MNAPRTIHDFSGFPAELQAFYYPAPGDPALAERVRELLAPVPVAEDHLWGLDHGAWSVLAHVFPQAKVPVIELSVDESAPAAAHYSYGQRLTALREENILIAASGNVVHNLRAYQWGNADSPPPEWASRFEKRIRQSITEGDDAAVIDYEKLGNDASLAAPDRDHFLPLLYILGTRQPGEPVSFPVEGTDGGSNRLIGAIMRPPSVSPETPFDSASRQASGGDPRASAHGRRQ